MVSLWIVLLGARTYAAETTPHDADRGDTDVVAAVTRAADDVLRRSPELAAAARRGEPRNVKDVKRLVYGDKPYEVCYLAVLSPAGYLLFTPRPTGGFGLSITDVETAVDLTALPEAIRGHLRQVAIENKIGRNEPVDPDTLIEYWTEQFAGAANAAERRKAAAALMKLDDKGAAALLEAVRTVEKKQEQGEPPTVEEALASAAKLRSHGDFLRAWDVFMPALRTVTTTDPLTSESIHLGTDAILAALRERFIPHLTAPCRRGLVFEQELSRYRVQAQDHFYKAARKLDPSVDEGLTAMFARAGYYELQRDNLKIANEAKLPHDEVKAIDALNWLRLMYGLTPVRIDPKLCETARDHCQDMVTLGFFAHESPVEGKKTPWDRARRFGTSAGGENIFAGSADPGAAINAWYYSPGHHRNEMGAGIRYAGAGRCQGHWTLMVR